MQTALIRQIIETILLQYQKNPENQPIIIIIRHTRQKLAEFWLNLPTEQLQNTYENELGKAHKMLSDSQLKYAPLTEQEQNFLQEIISEIKSGFPKAKIIQYLLAVSLYRRADHLPFPYQSLHIPAWFFNNYLQFMLDLPLVFQTKGEVENYYQYLQGFVDYIHQNIFTNPDDQVWNYVAWFFTQTTQFTPIQFSNSNLRDIYTKRANIQEYVLKSSGHKIDYTFPKRPVNRKKIRFGILKVDFEPHPETFITFPMFEHLDRDQFEIILYVIYVTGHPLEKYALSRADRLVKLPRELPNRVQTIRNDDLDILMIATLVTNATNNISFLALHRLARIQITSIASPVTTGMRYIDYYISGKLSEPLSEAQQHYREKLITLDGTGFCFSYIADPPPTITCDRQKLGISDHTIVFISAANFYKIIPEVRETWAKIISQVPNSMLLLLPFGSSWCQGDISMTFQQTMRLVFDQYHLPDHTLKILNTLPSRTDVKEILKLGDIYLNSYPYTGSTSLIDPLEEGLPTVIMDGNSLRSKMGSALLRDLQIPELITVNETDYIQLSIALATQPDLRQKCRDRIKEKMSNTPKFLDSQSYSNQIAVLLASLCSTMPE